MLRVIKIVLVLVLLTYVARTDVVRNWWSHITVAHEGAGTVVFKCVDVLSPSVGLPGCVVSENKTGKSCTSSSPSGECLISGLPMGRELRFKADLPGYVLAYWPADIGRVLTLSNHWDLHQFELVRIRVGQ